METSGNGTWIIRIHSSRVEESDVLLPVGPEDVDRAQDVNVSNNDPLNTESDSGIDTTHHPENANQQWNTSGPRFVKYPRHEHKAPDRYM